MTEDEEGATAMDLDGKDSASSSDESETEVEVEMLVSSRARRTTAGNRMSSMIGEIAADDDLELLFAEDEEAGPDEEFQEEAEEAGSDNDLGDSSDDEDHGAATGADDLEGEKEIERQAREERKRKRKAQQAFTRPSKKVKHFPAAGPTIPAVPAARSKKKVERLSWAPSLSDAVRSSRREATTQQSEALRTRIEAREEERRKQMKKLEAAAKKREASRAQTLTQEDRLKEAAEVERENSKSLNRWEALERERQEEQQARLAALQNRQLRGPVVSYWSGLARWVGTKLSAVGTQRIKVVEEKEASRTAQAKVDEREQGPKKCTDNLEGQGKEQEGLAEDPGVPLVRMEDADAFMERSTSTGIAIRPKSAGSLAKDSESVLLPKATDTSLTQLHSEPVRTDSNPDAVTSEVPAERDTAPSPISPAAIKQETPSLEANLGTSSQHTNGVQQIVFPVTTAENPPAPVTTTAAIPRMEVIRLDIQQPAGPPPSPPKPEFAARNLVTLMNVDVNAPPSSIPSQLRGSLLVSKQQKKARAAKAAPQMCPITGLPMQYRDPKTGVGYHNSYAYRQLQKVYDGRLSWSNLAGCYLNLTNPVPASGVPEGFNKI